MNIKAVVKKLHELSKNAKPGYKEGMARFGIVSSSALGVSLPELRKLGKEIGKDHELALKLWKLNIHEAKLLATMTADPRLMTAKIMDSWANDFYSWDIVDVCCGGLFDRTSHYQKKILKWVKNKKEYVRRAGFVLMATSAVHDKEADDNQFLAYLPIIEKYAIDERNFVKKAVNWALRQIGKRNSRLHGPALDLAARLKTRDSKTSRWIGSDAFRELSSDAVKKRLSRKK
jgi:3-methyladenine DNA glycosylase AlkD